MRFGPFARIALPSRAADAGLSSQVTWPSRVASEPDLEVRIVLGVDGVDEPHLMRHGGHDQGVGPRAVAEEAYPAQQGAVCDARRREDDALAGARVLRAVDAAGAGVAHAPQPPRSGLLGEAQPARDPAV